MTRTSYVLVARATTSYDVPPLRADSGGRRVVHRPQGDLGSMPLTGDVDLPGTGLEPVLGDLLVGRDERETDGGTERPAVRRRAHVADDLAVPENRLGVV